MKARHLFSWALVSIFLMPDGLADDSGWSLSQRRALFRVRQDLRFTQQAMASMKLLPWQQEAIQILLDEQSRVAELLRFGSNLEGREFEAKIHDLIEVTRDKIGSALPPEQRAEWMKLVSGRGLSFASKRVLASGTPERQPEP